MTLPDASDTVKPPTGPLQGTPTWSGATPATQLAGRTLPNGWTVDRPVIPPPFATGGTFSASYLVSRDDQRAFLKAMDFTAALGSPDPARALAAMTAAYNYERDLLAKCQSHRLSRIVRVLDAGTIPSSTGDAAGVVQYLIFELADGDVRSFVKTDTEFEVAWALRMIHHVTAALRQLHSAGIAHQDVKPSNILVFRKTRRSKLADLGRASDRTRQSPFDELPCAGDQTYAPPELLYGEISNDWSSRRLACDMYLLGSVVVFFCTGVSMTHLLLARLNDQHHYRRWTGTYREVLPYIQHHFSETIRDFRAKFTPRFPSEIIDVIRQLCNPDPNLRGHPRTIPSKFNRYSLERYISLFDRLASRAEYTLKGN